MSVGNNEEVIENETPELEEVIETGGEDDASEAPETEAEIVEEDEGDHPGALEDKAALEAAAAAKGAKKEEGTGAAASAAAFAPDFKVKAYGKDYEIPERFRALMTDEASAKEVRDVFEKSFAIDDYKPKQEQMRQKVEHYEQKVLPQYAKQDQVINECVNHLKNDDFESYFETLGVDLGRVMRWMDKRLSFTPEQLQLYNQNRALQKTSYQQSIENAQLKSSNEQVLDERQQSEGQQLLQQLDYTLAKGEYAERAKAYNEKNGNASALRDIVIKHGIYAKQVEGRSLTLEEAAKEVLDRVSPAIATQTSSVVNTKAAAPKEKPVLPVVKPRPVSPTVKQPNSISDIRKKAERMGAGQFDE